MKLDTEFSRDIQDAREIGEFLQLAFLQKWQFSCLQMVRNHLCSEEVEVLDVNVFDDNFIVDSDVLTVATQEAKSVTFKAQSGGLSLIFKTHPMKTVLDPSVCECKFELPECLRFAQLRKAVRINFRNQPEVRANLFADNGIRFDGQLMDLSTAGAKIQMLGDLTQQIEGGQIIEDCQFLLPGGDHLDIRAQVRGIAYDADRGLSIVRCEFIELSREIIEELELLLSQGTFEPLQEELRIAV